MKIKIRKLNEGSGWRWVLDYTPTGGKRVRRFFKSKAEADAAADDQDKLARRAGEDWLALTSTERADLIGGYAQIKTLGMTLHQILEQWRNGTAAAAAAQAAAAAMPKIAFEAAGREWIAHLKLKGRRPKTIRNYEHFLRRFGDGRAQVPVSSLTKLDYLNWLNTFTDPVTWNSLRDSARAFSSFCLQHELIQSDPICKDKLPCREVPYERPTIFTVEQVRSLLVWTMTHDRELLAYLALAIFCGIRPDELDRLTWDNIDLETGIVDISETQSKVKRPRQIHMHATAIAWVRLARENNARLPWNQSARIMRLKPLRDSLGFEVWPHDIMRHTYGSYYCELTRNIDATAYEMGNSAEIIERHYRNVVRPAACAEFWSLTPDVICLGIQPQLETVNP